MFLSRYCAEIMCCGRTVWKNGYNFEVKLPLQFSSCKFAVHCRKQCLQIEIQIKMTWLSGVGSICIFLEIVPVTWHLTFRYARMIFFFFAQSMH